MVGVSDNVRGFLLAISSSIFIGSSFIIKKKGLKKAGASGTRASLIGRVWPCDRDYRDIVWQCDGGYSYLGEPMWWAGMIAMVLGEALNFSAYAYAPAILVTPLGALSIIFSAVLAHFILKEKLHVFGIVGCILCLVGSITIVLHAPFEKDIVSVKQVWHLAIEPGYGSKSGCNCFEAYVFRVKPVCILPDMVFHYSRSRFLCHSADISQQGLSNIHPPLQALDIFNTAVVSPVYYVMFTILTIVASMIMFKWDISPPQNLGYGKFLDHVIPAIPYEPPAARALRVAVYNVHASEVAIRS
ncbi:hypothetical protein SASPL_101864 [Salvia splendens]|uniref:Probable magnesium transporter n=1 Tax=Salvia splendens TaxID=180675 RepID=A0A8X8YUT0_SALSN|nr:hypothetical protein SASPL_101864 [Salvia splendens]